MYLISSADLSETSGGVAITGGSKVPIIGGVSGLFVNGIPKKPSDNKRNQANIFKGLLLVFDKSENILLSEISHELFHHFFDNQLHLLIAL